MSFLLSCCSTADLSADYMAARDIRWLPFHFIVDGKDNLDDLGQTISYPEFYQMMRDGAMTSTSQIAVGEYEKHFETLLSSGQDVVHLSLSSGLSGTYQAATMAAESVRERFPDQKLFVVDSLAASSGYGLFMDAMADKRDAGCSAEEAVAFAEEVKLQLHHWFFSTDLTFYVRGGRVSKVAGWFGGFLDICPLLWVDREGKLVPRYKIRTKKRVIQAIVDKMEEMCHDGLGYGDKVFLSHSDCLEDAQAVAKLVEERFPQMKGKVLINNIGTTIGSHSGPGTVALFFWGKSRCDAQ